MKSEYNIAVLSGDGVGKEVIPQAINVLKTCAGKWDFGIELTEIECGAMHFRKTGKEWDDDAFETCKESDAMLLGAIGLPGIQLGGSDGLGSRVIFGLRLGLDLYANVRPTKLYTGVKHKVHGDFKRVWENVDFVVVRENTEDLYNPVKGMLSRGGIDEMALDTRIITRKGAERVIDFAFRLCDKRKRALTNNIKKLTCVDKSNVLRGCQLFRNIFYEIAKRYPSIRAEVSYVDAFAMNIIREPERCDVVVTSNLMGDILTDLSAALQGGLGIAPSANIGDNHALFEPVHGSAPDIAGKDIANPLGAILSTGMMLDWLGEKRKDERLIRASEGIDSAVSYVLKKGKIITPDLGGNGTCTAMGNAVIKELKGLSRNNFSDV